MISWKGYLLIVGILVMIVHGCQQPATRESNTLNIVLLHSDSVVMYHRSGNDFIDLKRSVMDDSVFMADLLRNIEEAPDTTHSIKIKPTDAGNTIANLEKIFSLLDAANLQKLLIDTLDTFEQQYFNCSSAFDLLKNRGDDGRLPLYLPKDGDPGKQVDITDNTISILLYGPDKLYIYKGKSIDNGKVYSFATAGKMLQQSKFTDSSKILIKAGKAASMKTVLDILDIMAGHKVNYYMIPDNTAEEEALLEKLEGY